MAGPAGTRSAFRGDINGLRALAVVVVVLYHFGVAGFSGGFVGVDVFFAISGFLMTAIVVAGLERGDFSLSGFYMARARRILPALLALCAALLALGWFVLLPPDYKSLGSQAVYSLAFLSNVEYWKEAGYFDIASHEKWLLHTWSLSVEWQFYLLLPIVLLATWRLKPGRAAQLGVVAVCFAASFGASVLVTNIDSPAAFFLLHTRAWEMLAGGMVYLLVPSPQRLIRYRRCLDMTGLVLILLSVALFDKHSAWPGWRAMLPVAGAMMVLASNSASAWTGNKISQWLGKRSYSLYLWHWPVYVSLAYIEMGHDDLARVAGMLATVVFGHVSYLWIENPARRLLEQRRFPHAASGLTALVACVALPSAAVWARQGIAGRFSPQIELAAAEAGNVNPRRAVCHTRAGVTSPSCVFGGAAWKVIVVGDSHAGAVVSGLAAAMPAGDAGVVQWSYSGCPFVFGLKKIPAVLASQSAQYKCSQFIEWARAQLQVLPPTIPIVIVGRYAAVGFGTGEGRGERPIPDVYFSKIYPSTSATFLQEFSQQITRSACELAKRRTVYMLRPIPEMGVDVPKTQSRRMSFGIKGDVSVSLAAYRDRNDWVWAAQNAARDRCGIKILDPLQYLCHDGRCYGSKDGRPLYHDDDHLSEFGNKLLVPMFSEVFKGR